MYKSSCCLGNLARLVLQLRHIVTRNKMKDFALIFAVVFAIGVVATTEAAVYIGGGCYDCNPPGGQGPGIYSGGGGGRGGGGGYYNGGGGGGGGGGRRPVYSGNFGPNGYSGGGGGARNGGGGGGGSDYDGGLTQYIGGGRGGGGLVQHISG